jgi:hypothetical protein
LSREIDVAIAVAREEVLETHTAQLLELIELSHDRVAPHRISEIYVRLHNIAEPEATMIRNRSLAVLGVRSRVARDEGVSAAQGLPTAENGQDPPRGPFRFLRERFRGRVHNELRRWIELHTGRAEMVLLEVHVRNALRVVKLLSEKMPINDAVQLYREQVGARDAAAHVIYWMVLTRLSETDLPMTVSLPPSTSLPELHANGDAHRKPNGRRAAAVRTPYRTL